ncbi:ead/Ea22-like family protein [Salmonella enterica subsp. enterica]|nr:ead/Ea22-like family protein [Salmonella enterica subsp. enterica serovar Oranienburg]
MSNIDKQALRERYSPKPVPKCHICGEEMTIQRMSASRITYGCTGATYDDKGCHYAEGRSIADDHYKQSRVTVVDVSDPDVLALLDELEHYKSREERVTKLVLDNSTSWDVLYEKLEAAEQERENWRISFDNERYRADKLAAALNAEREKLVMANRSLIIQHIRANSAESRIAELEARTVCLPKLPVLGSTTERYEGFAAGASSMRNECANAIHAAGIKVEGE